MRKSGLTKIVRTSWRMWWGCSEKGSHMAIFWTTWKQKTIINSSFKNYSKGKFPESGCSLWPGFNHSDNLGLSLILCFIYKHAESISQTGWGLLYENSIIRTVVLVCAEFCLQLAEMRWHPIKSEPPVIKIVLLLPNVLPHSPLLDFYPCLKQKKPLNYFLPPNLKSSRHFLYRNRIITAVNVQFQNHFFPNNKPFHRSIGHLSDSYLIGSLESNSTR